MQTPGTAARLDAGRPSGAPDETWWPAGNPEPHDRRRPVIEIEACRASDEAELARLRTQVAWLQAERAALWWAIGHDELTGLANRRLFQTMAPALLGDHSGEAAVVVLDLNGFKPVNDRLGHDAGDLVLRLVAERLTRCGDDLVARFGGDEFAAVLTGPPAGERWWEPSVRALSEAVAAPMRVAGQALSVTASIGVAPADGAPTNELLRRADLAMYRAKRAGLRYAAWCPEELEPPAPAYRRGDRVWVYRGGSWRPGVVEAATATVVMATYRCAQGLGTVVDTMPTEHVQPRADPDPHIDRATPRLAA